MAAFTAEHDRDAKTQSRDLPRALPARSPEAGQVTKFAAEAAIHVDDRAFALHPLLPLAAADPHDWQAAALLARVHAETGDAAKRDAELAHPVELHRAGGASPVARVQQVLLERIPEAKGSIRIWYSLEHWGRYRTYLFARIPDAAGHLAARGDRRFSLDGCGEDLHPPNGTVTQTPSTFGFFDGQPPYDTVPARIVQIAQQIAGPIR